MDWDSKVVTGCLDLKQVVLSSPRIIKYGTQNRMIPIKMVSRLNGRENSSTVFVFVFVLYLVSVPFSFLESGSKTIGTKRTKSVIR
jgi:hypothetical protein